MTALGAHRFAPAKINLFLHVGDKRADGYHNLASLVVFADSADRISLTTAPAFSLNVTGPQAGPLKDEQDNLVLKAARALASWSETRGHKSSPVALTLEKSLPVASGIGGGSSDAAATLQLLAEHWALPIHADDLHAIGASLGADVPVCLARMPMMISGYGDILTAINTLPDFSLVLVNPLVPVATGAVFRALEARSGAVSPILPAKPFKVGELATLLDRTINDLAAPAKSVAPIIMKVEQALVATDGCLVARMSGSGATCFGLYATKDAAKSAAASISKQNPNWWVSAAGLFSVV